MILKQIASEIKKNQNNIGIGVVELYKIKDKNANDYNNLGMLYSCHLKNHERAYDNYIRVLKLIQCGKVKENNAVNMMYKIEDIMNRSKTDTVKIRQNILRNQLDKMAIVLVIILS